MYTPPRTRTHNRHRFELRASGYDMKSCLLVTGVLSLGLLTTASAPAFAHHGNAAYADEITEFKQATVTKFAWANPHALINFDATDAKGNVVHMVVETAAPRRSG